MTSRCAVCDAPLPLGARSDKEYCSDKCQGVAYQREIKAARDEVAARRWCEICGGPIPLEKPMGTKFCGVRCSNSGDNPAKRLRKPVPCPQCGKEFFPFNRKQVTCSHKCAAAPVKIGGQRPCELCGKEFEARAQSRFCCRTCAARWNAAAGKNRPAVIR